jgi:hypothetical protein
LFSRSNTGVGDSLGGSDDWAIADPHHPNSNDTATIHVTTVHRMALSHRKKGDIPPDNNFEPSCGIGRNDFAGLAGFPYFGCRTG